MTDLASHGAATPSTSSGASATSPPRVETTKVMDFRVTALIVASALLMEQLDATVLATALPTMAKSFNVTPPHMSVALTAYLLSLAVFIPASGRLADRFGGRTVFATAILIFTAGSILCAIAGNMSVLVIARLVQGLGGAMMVPVGRLVMLRNTAKKDYVSAMAWMLVPALIGPILGPPLGGFIVTYFDWRWIFLINVPIGALGFGLVVWLFDNHREDEPGPIDPMGFVLSGVSLACLLFGFETASRDQGSAGVTALLIGVGAVAGLLYWRHAHRHPNPILDLTLMRIETFRLSVVAGSLTRITQGSLPYLLPLMLQVGFGLSAATSGLLTFGTACGAMLMKAAATPILRAHGFRTVLMVNSVASSLLYAVCAAFRPDWPHAAMFAVLTLCGFSMSLQFTAYNTVAYDEIDRSRMSQATAFYTTFQQLALSFGICTGALALHAAMLVGGHSHPVPWDFMVGFLVVTAISLVAAPINALLPPDAGADMTGHRRRVVAPQRAEARAVAHGALPDPAE